MLVNDWQRHETGGYRRQVLDRVLDAAHLVDSQLSAMTQLADMAAFVHRRRLYIPKENDQRAEAVMSEFHDLVMSGYHTPWGSSAAPGTAEPSTRRRGGPPSVHLPPRTSPARPPQNARLS